MQKDCGHVQSIGIDHFYFKLTFQSHQPQKNPASSCFTREAPIHLATQHLILGGLSCVIPNTALSFNEIFVLQEFQVAIEC